jgi:FPC/CPF motif-containing protein YcgG
MVDKLQYRSNPFPKEFSGYGKITGSEFISAYPKNSLMQKFHTDAQIYFKGFAGAQDFPCLAGRSIARTDQYAFCAYPDMKDPKIAQGLMHDMIRFQQEFGIPHDPIAQGHRFRSFVATFRSPLPHTPIEGAEALYELLGNMHEVNKKHYGWADGFSNNTDSPNFGYSSGDSAFFIASFHPGAYDVSRKSDINFVVFNSHAMLDALKAEGKFERLRDVIRKRQEHVHPYLGDHGEVLEWRQYALLEPEPMMEKVEIDLRNKVLGLCPFQPKK